MDVQEFAKLHFYAHTSSAFELAVLDLCQKAEGKLNVQINFAPSYPHAKFMKRCLTKLKKKYPKLSGTKETFRNQNGGRVKINPDCLHTPAKDIDPSDPTQDPCERFPDVFIAFVPELLPEEIIGPFLKEGQKATAVASFFFESSCDEIGNAPDLAVLFIECDD